MKEKLKELLILIKSINHNLMNFLAKKSSKKGFPLINNYGETSTAAAFSILNKHTEKIPELIFSYRSKEKIHIDTHWEFNNAALQQVNPKFYPGVKEAHLPLYYNMPFYRKVTNWMLLRSLAYLRDKNLTNNLRGHFIVLLNLVFQQGKGILYDERFARKRKISHQYQAFATSLLAEIYNENKNLFYRRRLKLAMKVLKRMTNSVEFFKQRGLRGYNQIFGYSSGIHALIMGSIIFNDSLCLDRAIMLAKHLKKYQRKDGSLPLVLSEKEFKLKKYEEGKLYPDWESYNTLYDYLGFTSLYLAKSEKLIKEHI